MLTNFVFFPLNFIEVFILVIWIYFGSITLSLEHLKVVTSKARLRELHQQMLKLKLKRIREEQMKELGDLPASTSQSASTTDAPMERPRPVVVREDVLI